MDDIFSPIVIGLRKAKSILAEGEINSGAKRAPLICLLVVLCYLLVAFTNASTIPDHAGADRVFTRFVSGVAIVVCVLLLTQMMLRSENHALFADRVAIENPQFGLWSTLAWFGGLLALTFLVGFVLAPAVFLLTFIRLRAGEGWGFAAAYTAGGIGFICLTAGRLNRDFPAGLLQDMVDLPWPPG